MTAMGRIRIADAFIDRLHDAGCLDKNRTNQVVFDFKVGEVPMMYVGMIVDEDVTEALLHAGLRVPRTLPVEAWRP